MRYLALLAAGWLLVPLYALAAPTISYVQGNYATPQSTLTTVAVTFNSAQAAGNLNVVVVGWNDSTAIVSSVTDTNGNAYQRAVGPTIVAGSLSQSIYYANNITSANAGVNKVTVVFSTAAAFPDIRILEYSGADPNSPVDVAKAGTGTGGTSNSGSVTTTNPTDLIFGANTVTGSTKGPGSGFTQRILTVPDNDIAEDRIVTATGSYSATAAVTGGRWIMQMVAFRTPVVGGTDSQPPTAPSNLNSTATSSSQINLSWTASTDNVGVTAYLVERCQGAGCNTFAQIGTATTTTFGDSGLIAGTSYSYRVRATDAAGNLSGYSNVASATTQSPDTQPPTAPSNLVTNASSSSQISLSWTASTDNVGVTGYLIERCQGAGCTNFVQIATTTALSFNDTGLTAGTSYSYRVRATDAAGNLSGYSNVATATTQSPDTQPPTTPSSLGATAVSSSQINLSWTASTDNVGVTNYLVERCQGAGCTTFAQIGTSTSTTFSNTGLTAATAYSYRVRATDAAGNLSGYSNVASATTQTASTIAFVQSNYADPQSTSFTSVAVKFNTAQTVGNLNVIVVGWNDTTATVSSVTDTSGNNYQKAVGPTTISGTLSQSIYYAKNIVAAAAGANTVTVQFSTGAAYPDVRILEYSGADLVNPIDVTAAATGSGGTSSSGSATTTTATDLIFGANIVTGATSGPGTGFTQRILTSPNGDIAEDRTVTATGGYSATAPASGSWVMQMVAFRTQSGSGVVDTQPPTAPNNPGGTAISGTQVNLSWTASTDNVGVAGYMVERCQGSGCNTFAQVGTATGTTFNDTGLTAGTAYSYRVRAADAAGNLSPYSNVASVTTQSPDTQPPTTPTNLTASATSGSQINLSWSTSTDNVGVTGYLIERCQGAGCSNFARIATVPTTAYSDTGLTSNTSYTYQVKATDAAGNFSAYSNTATATTLATISGLVTAYSFDEDAGITVNDLSGNGNTGTVSNTTWTTSGKYGSALVFNGTSSRVTINDSAALHLTSAMTLEAWVKPSAVSSAWRDVIYKGNDNYFLEATSTNSSVPAGGGTFGGASGLVVGSSSLPVNTWSHLALTYDGATLRLYVNGVQVSSTAQTGSILTSTNPLQIGGDSIFGQFFAGAIDEVRVYNTALNQSQVQSDMGAPVGGASGPVVNLNPTSINFGNVPTGTTSSAVPVTLTNAGSTPLTINSVGIFGGNSGDFAQTNNCGASLGAATSCTINVTFTPTTTGSRISALSISDNAAGTPHSVNLSGTGTGFSISPRVAALTFTRTQQFTASAGGATWSVDGVAGGSAAGGTITAAGLYTPPASQGTHIVTATTSSQSASATVYITNYPGTFTHHNDNLRTGANTSERVLSPSNVNQAQFGKVFTYTLDGIAFASPLYVANVNIPGQGFHNVAYVATEHDSVYAWDADGLSTIPLWKTSFLGTGIKPVPCADTGECGDIPTEIGITGTPTIDQATGTLYVVAKTKEGVNYVQRLHALDMTTGAEKFGGPVVIQATVAGSGSGSQSGQLRFDPLRENQRPALVLSNGVVYIGWASHGDQIPWHGWVIGYNATTLQQVAAYCVSPDGYGGGIWSSGGGLGADASGNIYFTTGNGDFNANTGGRDFGDTVVKIGPSGNVVDYFTPFDQANMEANNFDLSSAGPVLLLDQPGPISHLLVAAAKSGTIYVVNRDNMGHFHAGSDSQIVQSLVGVLPNGMPETGNYSAPAFFNNYVYFAAVNDTLKAFQLVNGLLSSGPTSQSFDVYPNRGGSFTVSGNGTSNGIIWAVQDNNPNPGVLHAYDAGNLASEFYNTSQAGTRDTLGVATKFSIPLVANGKVFVGAQTQLVVYGLLP